MLRATDPHLWMPNLGSQKLNLAKIKAQVVKIKSCQTAMERQHVEFKKKYLLAH